MKNSQKTIGINISLLTLFFLLLITSPAVLNSSTKEKSFDNQLTNDYYYVKSLVFSKNMIVKESLLITLLASIEDELESRVSNGDKIDLPSDDEIKELSKSMNIISVDIDKAKVSEIVGTFKEVTLEEYNLKLLKARLIKAALVTSSDDFNRHRMFNGDFKIALKEYANNNYEFAYFLFNEILSVYNYKNLDDVLFFTAECQLQMNNITQSLRIYRRILDEYNESEYISKAYSRLIELNYVKGNFNKSLNTYRSLTEEKNDNVEEKTFYIAGLSAYRLKKYRVADEILTNVSELSEYYNHALYLRANSLTIIKQYAKAKELYKSVKYGGFLSDKGSLKNEIYQGSLLKLGYLTFNVSEQNTMLNTSENGGISKDVSSAIKEAYEYFDRIDNDSKYYEDALMGKAWVEHNLGEFDKSNAFIVQLLELNAKTDFLYEARTLKGFNNDLIGVATKKNRDYEFVLSAHLKFQENENYTSERMGVLKLIKNLNELKSRMLEDYSDISKFEKYYSIKHSLMSLLKNSENYLETIEESHPNIAYITNVAYEKQVLRNIINDSRREINRLNSMHKTLVNIEERIKNKSNFKELVRISIAKDQISATLKKADILNIYSDNKLLNIDRRKIDLERWSDLSFLKYIISNIGIEELDKIESEITILESKVDDIDELIESTNKDGDGEKSKIEMDFLDF